MVRQDRRCNPLHGYLKDDRAARLVLSFIRSAEFVDKFVVPIVLPSSSIYLRSSTLTYLPPAARTSARLPGRTTSKQTPSVIRLLKTRASGWKIIDCLAGIPNSSSFSSICATSSTNGRIFWASCRETFSIFGMIVSTQSSIVGVRGGGIACTVDHFSPFPSNTSSSSTVLLRRPLFNSIVLRCGADNFGSVSVSITNECSSLSMRPRTTSATERIHQY